MKVLKESSGQPQAILIISLTKLALLLVASWLICSGFITEKTPRASNEHELISRR